MAHDALSVEDVLAVVRQVLVDAHGRNAPSEEALRDDARLCDFVTRALYLLTEEDFFRAASDFYFFLLDLPLRGPFDEADPETIAWVSLDLFCHNNHYEWRQDAGAIWVDDATFAEGPPGMARWLVDHLVDPAPETWIKTALRWAFRRSPDA